MPTMVSFASVAAVTSDGRFDTMVPALSALPSCPYWFDPHVYSSPSDVSAMAWYFPAATCTTLRGTTVTTSPMLLVHASLPRFSPRPSCPYLLLPMLQSRPVRACAIENVPPATTDSTGTPKFTSAGAGFAVDLPRPLVCPSCPIELDPQAHSLPSCETESPWLHPAETVSKMSSWKREVTCNGSALVSMVSTFCFRASSP
mmetsp:Transcript_69080/g.144028  ORF Transcript_69080/g.144028 Transcript_69080/m.144028 type:complete len:201 (-) Transcript_69080:657-1259(-)